MTPTLSEASLPQASLNSLKNCLRLLPLLALQTACASAPAECKAESPTAGPSAAHGEGETHSHHGEAETHSHEHPGGEHAHGGATAPTAAAPPATAAEARVIPHADLKSFSNNGNELTGIATRSQGAQSFEVWHSEVAPGGSTPLHQHTTEEVFVVLRGEGIVIIGDRTIPFKAPATVIAPAGVPHQLKNTGTVPTEQIVIIGIDSTITDASGTPLELPWRK